MALAEAEMEPEPLAPLGETTVELDFAFELVEVPLPTPREAPADEAAEGEEPPAEEEAPPPTMAGTYFAFSVPAFGEGAESGAEPTTFELAHPLTGDEGAPPSSSAELVVSEALVRWLVLELQGVLPLVLRRRGAEGGADEDICTLPLDLAPLIFGKQRASSYFGADGAPVGAESVSTLPAELSGLASSAGVSVSAGEPLLSVEMREALNPMSVTLVRADDLPSSYSGTPYMRPYEELSSCCEPVSVTWRLLGEERTSAGRAHGPVTRWPERTLMLVGSRLVDPADLARQLRADGVSLELHDRDPLPPPPPKPATPKEGAGEEGEAAPDAEAAEVAEAAEAAAPAAEAPKGSASTQHPPFGVARASLSQLVPRRMTDAAPAYAPGGLPVRPPRRLTLEIEVEPCERPKERPEPEEVTEEYRPGKYVEHGTTVTLAIELAGELPPEAVARPKAELQRVVTMIKYADTPMLKAILAIIHGTNVAIGLTSASAWEEYKEEAREDLDLVTGVQLVDGEARLFVLEGLAASGDNAMARLGALLERRTPNGPTAFTLMNTRLTFGERLYNTYEMPTKLFKLRSPIPALLLRPDVYQYLRVQEGCREALLCLGRLLQSPTLRHAQNGAAFPHCAHLLQLEKKFGGVELVSDREGVAVDGDDEDEYDEADTSPAAAAERRAHRHRAAPRKAPTEDKNEGWYASLAARAELPPLNYIRRNMDELPVAPTPQPLPSWYLDTIAQISGPVYMYSGQRLNQTDTQKAALRAALEKLQKETGVQMSYNKEYLWADSVGDREPLKHPREAIASLKPDAHLKPWDAKRPTVTLRDGRLSQHRILQPSDYRAEELMEPWDEETIRASRKPVSKKDPPVVEGRGRWDPNPCPNNFLDENPRELYRSVFSGQTEEQMAAEQAERVEGAIGTWKSKLVVDDPVLRVDLRSRDHVPQQDRLLGLLKDPPVKRSYKALYRKGDQHALTRTSMPSMYLAEPPTEQMPESLQLTWRASTSWKPARR